MSFALTALGLRFFLELVVLMGLLASEAIAFIPKKQLVNSGFAATLAELPPPSHNCDLLTKTTYGYDANGNRLTRKIGPNTDLYSYDFENRLTALTKTTAGGEVSYEYAYDYRTRRVYRAEAPTNGPNVETQTVFSGGTSIQEITLGNTPELAVEYIRGSDYGGASPASLPLSVGVFFYDATRIAQFRCLLPQMKRTPKRVGISDSIASLMRTP